MDVKTNVKGSGSQPASIVRAGRCGADGGDVGMCRGVGIPADRHCEESRRFLLLLIYWAISILLLGRDVAALARSLPAMRNTLLRFLELTESPEEHAGDLAPVARPGGAKIDIEEGVRRRGGTCGARPSHVARAASAWSAFCAARQR